MIPPDVAAEDALEREAIQGAQPDLAYDVESGLVANRIGSVDRRFAINAKPCTRCGALVLWRHEAGQRIALDPSATRHDCRPSLEAAERRFVEEGGGYQPNHGEPHD